MSHPSWVHGLKHLIEPNYYIGRRSDPSWVRGLKCICFRGIYPFHRSPYGFVSDSPNTTLSGKRTVTSGYLVRRLNRSLETILAA